MKIIFFISVMLIAFMFGCSPRQMMLRNISDNLAKESTVFTGDDDPQLVRDALPFTIKFHEILLNQDNKNPQLHLSTGKLFILNAQVFLMMQADTMSSDPIQANALRQRAKSHFLRGRDYILNGLDLIHPGIKAEIRSGSVDSALSRVSLADTSYLYWASAAWLGAVNADRRDFALGLTARRPLSMLQKTVELKSNFGNGSAHEALSIYLASAPSSLGGDKEKANYHFQKALQYSSNNRASTFVTGAKSFALQNNDKSRFSELLSQAINIDPAKDSTQTLLNTVYRDYAKWLLDNKGKLFKEDE
ncbi:TRAP transporter TatT component family protein [Chitinispirillales bacterium ANBcel5]|uniref:TRAP transporter TatT component family protein n=1 Tax=Cellulosispirillum alkaliphilum TaxID=3039283 RepID=UPI002A5907D8|nr:TRAP transporter TatT component family protein [Chitinispirillales bacterium ANBcel5]